LGSAANTWGSVQSGALQVAAVQLCAFALAVKRVVARKANNAHFMRFTRAIPFGKKDPHYYNGFFLQ
jgi:hypothetical protein